MDIGDPPPWSELLQRELRPTPERLGNALRLTLFGLLTVTIGETFRLPNVLLFAYIGFVVFSSDAGSTTTASLAGAAAVAVATVLLILLFMVSLSQPALRLPLMAAFTFGTGFITKAAKLGHGLQIFGMWTVYNIPQGDSLRQGALAQTYVSGNTTSNTLPNLLFMSPEESLVHTELWTAFQMMLAVALLYAYNRLLGRDPARILRADQAARLEAAAQVCDGTPGAGAKLAKLARQGMAKALKLQAAAETWHRGSPRHDDAARLIAAVDRLCLLVLAWRRVATEPPGVTLTHAARTCHAAAGALRRNTAYKQEPVPTDGSGHSHGDGKPPPAVAPLAADLAHALAEIRGILSDAPREKSGKDKNGKDKKQQKGAGGMFLSDAWSNPAYVQFGLKLTLCAAIAYGAEMLTDWSGIGTCLITVFIVSFESVGETGHKAVMRISGCLLGAMLGWTTILLLMPVLTTLGDFLLAMAGPLFLAAWIKSGSERSNYVGQQIAIAFFACVISGYGPTIEMSEARDRIIGILLGDVTVFVVFTTIWPVSIAVGVRKDLGQAFERLADLVAPSSATSGPETKAPDAGKLRQAFDQAIAGSQASLVNDHYEPGWTRPDRSDLNREHRLIGTSSLASLQVLVLPISMITALPQDTQGATARYQAAMADWFHGCARWMQDGTDGGTLLATLPRPPGVPGTGLQEGAATAPPETAGVTWCGFLHDAAAAMIRHLARPRRWSQSLQAIKREGCLLLPLLAVVLCGCNDARPGPRLAGRRLADHRFRTRRTAKNRAGPV